MTGRLQGWIRGGLYLFLLVPSTIGRAVQIPSSSSSTRSSHGTTTPPPFVPCTAPRFDSFAETLVGPWWTTTTTTTTRGNKKDVPQQDDDSDPAGNKKDEEAIVVVVTVDEVMRRCGGAVQGIRDHGIGRRRYINDNAKNENDNENNDSPQQQQQQSSSSLQEGLYLNRADDGFVFWDSGAYSFGPTTTTTTDCLPSSSSYDSPHERLWVSNFMMGSTRRLVLALTTTTTTTTATTNDTTLQDVNPAPSSILLLLRKTSGGILLEAPTTTVVTLETKVPFQQTSVVWEQVVQCSMPRGAVVGAAGQLPVAWNLPRAQWTKRRSDSAQSCTSTTGSGGSSSSTTTTSHDISKLTCWVNVDQSVASFVQWIMGPSSASSSSSSSQDFWGLGQDDLDHGTLCFMGVQCPSPNGQIQGMARIYNKVGTLSNVLFVQGTVVP